MENDESLILAFKSGETEKFGLLYDKYIKKIYDYVFYQTRHKETAEDIVSLTFFKALEKIDTFKIGSNNFSAWLYKIAKNNVIDHYRKNRPSMDIDDLWGLGKEPAVEMDYDAKLKLDEVKKQLEKFKPEQKEIIILRVWQGLSYKEIAEITGKSESGCKMVFLRAISSLRNDLRLTIIFLLIQISLQNK